MRQLLPEHVDRFQVVFDPGSETEFTVPVEFFALCDLVEKPCQGDPPSKPENCRGVILPVIFDEDEGLQPELLSYYKLPSEQEVCLRRSEKVVRAMEKLESFEVVCGVENPCCDRRGEYNGFGSDGPLKFTCPKHCSCHD